MSEELEPTDLAKRRISYSSKIAALQFEEARTLYESIAHIPAAVPEDPLVLALFQAISRNYAALVSRPQGK